MNALKLSVFALATMLAAPAFASHAETHSTGWFEYQWNADDDAVIYCNAINTVEVGGGVFIHDRPGPGSPYGTGLVSDGGGGTWGFLDDNGIPGIQIGGSGALGTIEGVVTFEDPFQPECPNGDTVLF